MKIITTYGSIDIEPNNLKTYELSNEAIDFIKRHIAAAEMFFAEEVDLTKISTDENLIQEFVEIVIIENKFSSPERAFALSKYTHDSLIEITESSHDEAEFSTGSGDYLVLTDEEATERAEDLAKTYYGDLDDDATLQALKHHNFSSDFIDISWFDDAMDEYNRSYADDIRNETYDDSVYISRLHEEMCNHNILSEPEWPDEDDYSYYREDFDEEEPDEDDQDAHDEWEASRDEWEENQDRLEEEMQSNYEEAKENYKTDLENDIDNAFEEFVEKLNNEYEDGLDYYINTFGESETAEIINSYNLADQEALGLQLLDDEGRGYFLDSYSGSEDFQTSTYRNEKYEFYFYRIN